VDLSKFTAIKRDANSTTLKHPDGHEIKIAHANLSPKMRGQVQKLDIHNPQKLCEGGMSYADGGEVANQMADAQSGQGMTPAPDQSGQAQAVAPPADAPQAPTQDDSDPTGSNAYSQGIETGLAEEKAGIAGAAQAQSQEGQEQAKALTNQIGNTQQLIQKHSEEYGKLEGERQAAIKDIQGNLIDPNHYWNSLSTGQHIAAGIGLALGGFNQALNGGSNLALDVIKNHINNDIGAQQANLGARKSLLEANLHQFGNLQDATSMTRVMQQDLVSNQLKLAAANAATPAAQANALMAAGKLDHDSAAELSQIAIRKTLAGQMQQQPQAMNQTPQSAINQNINKVRLAEMSGFISKENATDARKVLEAGSNVQDTLDEMKQFMQKGTALPLTARRGQAEALQAKAIAQVNHLAGLTRLSGEDIAVINKQLPDLTSLLSGVTGQNQAKVNEFQKTISSQLNAHLKTVLPGFTPVSGGAQQSSGYRPKSFKPVAQ
jgi:hypothetical protein